MRRARFSVSSYTSEHIQVRQLRHIARRQRRGVGGGVAPQKTLPFTSPFGTTTAVFRFGQVFVPVWDGERAHSTDI